MRNYKDGERWDDENIQEGKRDCKYKMPVL